MEVVTIVWFSFVDAVGPPGTNGAILPTIRISIAQSKVV